MNSYVIRYGKDESGERISYKDDEATKQAVFDAVIAFLKKHKVFCAECICQSDNPQIEAPVLLANIAEDILELGKGRCENDT